MNTMRYWYQLLPELRRRPNDGLICALWARLSVSPSCR
jgi:hypothetical protein